MKYVVVVWLNFGSAKLCTMKRTNKRLYRMLCKITFRWVKLTDSATRKVAESVYYPPFCAVAIGSPGFFRGNKMSDPDHSVMPGPDHSVMPDPDYSVMPGPDRASLSLAQVLAMDGAGPHDERRKNPHWLVQVLKCYRKPAPTKAHFHSSTHVSVL